MGEQDDPTRQQQDARPQGRVDPFRLRIFGWISSVLVRLLGATWRCQVLGSDPREVISPSPAASGGRKHSVYLGALFHESMLPAAHFFRDRGYSIAISRSRDGDLIDATLACLGYGAAARGSSSRGGSATLRSLVRQIEAGASVAMLVDGPRGPARVSKTGIIAVARLSGIAIQPVAFSARPAIRLKSWDGSLIPLPFARVVCGFGEPVAIGPKRDDRSDQSRARELDRRITALHHATDQVLL